MNDLTINLASVPLTDFSEPDVGKSNLWGSLLSSPPFGQTSMVDPTDECWRRLEFSLWMPTVNSSKRKRLPNGDIEYTVTVNSSCGGKCGYLDKKCICVPPGIIPPSKRGIKTAGPPCSQYAIVRWNKEHDYCPPLKDCSPHWRVEPLPPGCPPAHYTLVVVFVLPASATLSDIAKTLARGILDAMDGEMDETLARLAAQGKNMMCDGGPEDIEPPQG